MRNILGELLSRIPPRVDWWNVGLGAAVAVTLAVAAILYLASCSVVTVNAGAAGEAPAVIRIDPSIGNKEGDADDKRRTPRSER